MLDLIFDEIAATSNAMSGRVCLANHNNCPIIFDLNSVCSDDERGDVLTVFIC